MTNHDLSIMAKRGKVDGVRVGRGHVPAKRNLLCSGYQLTMFLQIVCPEPLVPGPRSRARASALGPWASALSPQPSFLSSRAPALDSALSFDLQGALMDPA